MTRSPRPRRTPRRTPRLALAAALVAVVVGGTTALPAHARTTRSERAERATRSERPRRAATGLDATTAPAAADRTLVATGTARVRGVPDVLTMNLGVSTRGDSVGDALGRNNDAIRKVMAVLRDGDVDEKDIQTSSFSISPYYDDNSEIDGYQVSNLVTVQLRDLAKAGTLIDKAAGAGGDDVVMRGVSFGFDDTSALVAQARTDAVKRARAQAEQLSEAAGVTLVEVRTISESSYDPGPVAAAPQAELRAADSVAIAPGAEELSVQVTVVYTIR
ncbi:MAG: DUF541 domain-containing protein [Actinobacteria bacterium]|nr:DUF541 domain-containing protein [Actinomycetota bacterium]